MSKQKITWGSTSPLIPSQKVTTAAVWRQHGGPAWKVQFEYVDRQGQPTPIGVHIQSASKTPTDLTSRAIRDIPLATIFEEWLKQTSEKRPRPSVDTDVVGPLKGAPLPREVIEKVAELYRDALSRGLPPNKFVAEALSISHSTATKRIIRARREGLLGPTTPGRQGEMRRRNEPEA